MIAGLLVAAIAAVACGGEAEVVEKVVTVEVEKPVTVTEQVIQTVVVEKVVEGKTVTEIQTVVVEKVVEGKTVTEVQTVVVEKPVTVTEKVVETVIVEKVVEGKTIMEVQTVIVERPVTVIETVVETVVVEKPVTQTITKVEERVIVHTATPIPAVRDDVPAPRGRPGTITFAMLNVGKGTGINSAQSGNYRWGITEAPFMTVFPGEVTGMVISDWERSPDGDKLFLTVKDGVEFHDGWGPFTAEDLAWNLTDTNATTNPESISSNAGDYGALFNSHTAIDDKTVEIEINLWDVRWAANQLNSQGQTMEIFSKKAFDEKGRDWMLENIIGTGPFQAIEFRDEERIIAEAVDNHHRQTPLIDQIIYIEVTEAATRKAMMLTGEVDGAELILPDRKDLAERGFIWVPANSGKEQVVIFGGNYWETERIDTKEQLEPWNLAGYQTDLPWIGCPWEDMCPYEDTNNPDGMDDMEQARLVRWAMAMAYDRELINDTLFAGQAQPDHISMFIPSLPEFKDEWKVPFDPEKSKEYLAMAGFPDGFEHTFLAIAGFSEEVQQAIAGYWENIGIKTEIQIVDYAGVFRPTVVDRSNYLVYAQGCRHHNGLPFDWPRGPQNTSLTRGGFGCGIEMPFIAEGFVEANTHDDVAERIRVNTKVAEQMHFWMPQSGIAVVPNGMIINPKSIDSWQMLDGFESSAIQGPEFIVPVSR